MKKYILGFLGLMLLAGSLWTYKLIWGKHHNFNHFIERYVIEELLSNPQLFSYIGASSNTSNSNLATGT